MILRFCGIRVPTVDSRRRLITCCPATIATAQDAKARSDCQCLYRYFAARPSKKRHNSLESISKSRLEMRRSEAEHQLPFTEGRSRDPAQSRT